MFLKTTLAASAIALLTALPLGAEEMNHDDMNHDGMDMSQPMGDDSPSSKAFAQANAAMHKDMAVPLTGDTDADFVRGMIPHHQGAIDMARIELEFGKDPQIRKLAEEVIKAQEGEIKMMRDWLAAHGK